MKQELLDCIKDLKRVVSSGNPQHLAIYTEILWKKLGVNGKIETDAIEFWTKVIADGNGI
jgi:hypothetical protein